MAVTLQFLGRLEDAAGMATMPVEQGAGLTLESLIATLPVPLAMALADTRLRVAINGALVAQTAGVVLADGDEVAFLPPVSGG